MLNLDNTISSADPNLPSSVCIQEKGATALSAFIEPQLCCPAYNSWGPQSKYLASAARERLPGASMSECLTEYGEMVAAVGKHDNIWNSWVIGLDSPKWRLL